MNKKRLFLLILVAACVVCGVYFAPQHFTMSGELQIVVTDIGVENGEPKLDTKTYTELTEEQIAEICEILDNYAYYRTPATPFTDGSLDDLSDRVMHLYFFRDGSSRTYALSPAGKLATDGKTYRMGKAKQCMNDILSLLELERMGD